MDVIMLTRERYNIISIKYENDSSEVITEDGRRIEVHGEFVNVEYASGLTDIINVTADSGMAMICDIMKQLRF